MVGEELSKCGGGVVLHSGKHVLVGRHRERGVGMAEAFGDDLYRDPVTQQKAGVGVAQIVEPDR